MADDLSFERSCILEDLTGVCYIRVPTKVVDGAGGRKVSWADGQKYKCSVQEGNAGMNMVVAGQPVSSSPFTIVLPWNAQVTSQNRIRVGSNEYEVLSTNGDRANRLSLRCSCKLIQ